MNPEDGETAGVRPGIEHHIPAHGAAGGVRFDLPAEIADLRRGRQYDSGGPAGRTLLKEPDLRIVLIALRAGGRMEEHRASGPSSIQVIEGSLHVHVAGGRAELGPGSLLALDSAVSHDVEAAADSAFLLTLGRTTYEHVSASHEPKRQS